MRTLYSMLEVHNFRCLHSTYPQILSSQNFEIPSRGAANNKRSMKFVPLMFNKNYAPQKCGHNYYTVSITKMDKIIVTHQTSACNHWK